MAVGSAIWGFFRLGFWTTLWLLFLCVNGGDVIHCGCWTTLVVFLSVVEVALSTIDAAVNDRWRRDLRFLFPL
ncbi:uncharacterized protein HKW66_Vig0045540 [Vigna angularis]|uniref:Uncharacterized protein n=1 Tax=Phaseolus angularis TaxID=3914 RepID=A0A8T0L0P0_PHAAN|nr:uncharacterized protein HKW66_Vig0045540 [Vigna angularis]